jgi:hypothetical protein
MNGAALQTDRTHDLDDYTSASLAAVSMLPVKGNMSTGWAHSSR